MADGRVPWVFSFSACLHHDLDSSRNTSPSTFADCVRRCRHARPATASPSPTCCGAPFQRLLVNPDRCRYADSSHQTEAIARSALERLDMVLGVGRSLAGFMMVSDRSGRPQVSVLRLRASRDFRPMPGRFVTWTQVMVVDTSSGPSGPHRWRAVPDSASRTSVGMGDN